MIQGKYTVSHVWREQKMTLNSAFININDKEYKKKVDDISRYLTETYPQVNETDIHATDLESNKE